MTDLGTYIDDTLQFVRVLPGPVERVWDFLTASEHRAEWLAGGAIEPRVGGAVRLTFAHDLLTPHPDPVPERFAGAEGYALDGTVTIWDPPHRLAFTWPEPSAPDGEVHFALEDVDGGVRLTLTHHRIGTSAETRVGLGAGWHTHLGVLVHKANGEVPPAYWATYLECEDVYRARPDATATGEPVAA